LFRALRIAHTANSIPSFEKSPNFHTFIFSNIGEMNYIDIIIIALIALAMVRGFMNGFIKEVASLAALILGIWGAIKFSSFTAEKLYDYFEMSGKYVGIVAFLVTMCIIAALIQLMGMVIDKFVKAAALGLVNRLLGIGFGLLKSILILSVIFMVMNAIDARRPFLPKEKIEKSLLYSPISDIAPAIFPIVGEGGFLQSFDRFKKKPEGASI
jgi:membrane protein required for colicin V production